MTSKDALAIHTILCERYSIERVIGEGGFGITYYARHIQLGTYVAIKEFFLSGTCTRNPRTGMVSFPEMRPEVFEKYCKRFQNEARTLCQLDNPHVVHVHDIFNQNGTSYIVMDYIKGETLLQLIQRKGALPYAEAINYIAQLCEAVEHIHNHHILHRDIKPSNIMITPDYNVVLIDFGAARSFVHDREQRHTTMLTMGYAPIEQYTATSKKGNYTDLYAVGGVFYYAVTGQHPIPAADRILKDTLVEPRMLNPSVPKDANRIIMKALRVNPEERYQDAQTFRNDLLDIKNTPLPKKTKKQTTPIGLIVIIFVLVCVFINAGIAAFLIWDSDSEPPTPLSQDTIVNPEDSARQRAQEEYQNATIVIESSTQDSLCL